MELKRREMLEEVLEVIGSGKRLATLEQVANGTATKDIHKHIDASRSGVQNFVTDFRETGLITADNEHYELTRKGEAVVNALQDLDATFKQFERERLRGFAFQSSLSAEEIEEILEEVREEKKE